MRNYDFIRETATAAANRWPMVLSQLGIDVPRSPRQHAPCPACGGKDRFRFDDKGRGSFFCNQCGAGDGLDLIQKVNQCGTTEAARMAADVLGIDYRVTETDQKAASQRRQQLDEQRHQHEQQRQQKEAAEAEQRRESFVSHYQRLSAQTTSGESEYLIARGLNGFTLPCLPDGAILLPLVDESGGVVAAQTITQQGEKKVLYGSAKRGAWHIVNQPQEVKEIIIGEGLATTLTAHLIRPYALAVVALDAGNLPTVAETMRRLYPNAAIIISGDNDWHEPGELDDNGKPKVNGGKMFADKAAEAVNANALKAQAAAEKLKAETEQAGRFSDQQKAAADVAVNPYTGEATNPAAQVELEQKQKLAAVAKYEAMGAMTEQQAQDTRTAIVKQGAYARMQIVKDEAQKQIDSMSMMLGGFQSGFEGLANIVARGAGESSSAYKALFAVSKGFAIAQAGLNLQLAISNAMASGPFPWNLANMAQVAAAGGQVISAIGGASYGGAREHGGPVQANSMYRVGEGGKPEIFKASNGSQYMIPGDSGKVISNKDIAGAGGNGGVSLEVNFNITTTNGIDDATQKQMIQQMEIVALKVAREQSTRDGGFLQKRIKK
ncbi:phage/plasmid primase-like uncharacterized protein [Pantoea dispersa]|nr:phage/plasmid primase-like uncharacterized protein [Pantoea dispersa]